MKVGDLIGVRGYVLKHTYIPLGMKRKFCVNCNQRGKLLGISVEDWQPFILV